MRAYLDGIGVNAAGTELSGVVGLPASNGQPALSGSVVASVWASRNDVGNTTEVRLQTTVARRRGDNGSQSVEPRVFLDSFTLEPGDWTGLDYALLANNVNCILCHAEIGSSEVFYNQGSRSVWDV